MNKSGTCPFAPQTGHSITLAAGASTATSAGFGSKICTESTACGGKGALAGLGAGPSPGLVV